MEPRWPPLTNEERVKLGIRIRSARTHAPLKTAKEVEDLLWVLAKKHTKPVYRPNYGAAIFAGLVVITACLTAFFGGWRALIEFFAPKI